MCKVATVFKIMIVVFDAFCVCVWGGGGELKAGLEKRGREAATAIFPLE